MDLCTKTTPLLTQLVVFPDNCAPQEHDAFFERVAWLAQRQNIQRLLIIAFRPPGALPMLERISGLETQFMERPPGGDAFALLQGKGMLLQAMNELPIIPERSLMLGDRPKDMQAARRAGVRGLHFHGGNLFQFLMQSLNSSAL